LPLVLAAHLGREGGRRAEDIDLDTDPPGMPGYLTRHLLRLERRDALVLLPHHVPHEPSERRKLMLRAEGDLRLVEGLVVVLCRGEDRVVTRRVGLDGNPSSRTSPARASGHLGKQLE